MYHASGTVSSLSVSMMPVQSENTELVKYSSGLFFVYLAADDDLICFHRQCAAADKKQKSHS